ncbi:MAG: biosynthetic-type acetolactate synthase large subunit [Rectinemataceae bacterium]|nr:biosynthetic-type acetolactate synthase large subunit [Rectinemataceae bacterium]
MQYSGSRILIECLLEQGVDTIFGYPGGTVLYIYDELFKQKDRIRHILTSHEQGAAHAADGYARSTGKVGVCLATSGPGATNLVTGIATAYMDSIPMVAITGNVPTALLGKDSFQEIDIAGVTMPITKHNWIVRSASELAEVMREAFLTARSGRPGPVLVDIPKDVSAALAEWEPMSPDHLATKRTDGVSAADLVTLARGRRLDARTARDTFTPEQIKKAAAMLAAAEKPFIYAGGGVISSEASAELKTLAERLHAPVATSLMGQGAFPYYHPLATGMVGMHGTKASNTAMQCADLVIAIGARFSDRVVSRADRFALQAKVLHIDIDPAEINKNIKTAFSIIGDIKEVLGSLLTELPVRGRSTWNGEIEEWKKVVPSAHSRETPLHPRFIMEEIHARVGDEAIVATDVGQHQMWTAQFFPFSRPRSFISSGGLGTMGFGMGAAIGAKIANPDRPVVLITGDGSFRMNCNELATAASFGVNFLIVVVNNGTLGMVRQWQSFFYDARYSHTDLNRPPDFVKLAEAYDLSGFRAADEGSFTAALDEALAVVRSGKAALVDAHIDIDERVLPMVPGGKAIDEQILEE